MKPETRTPQYKVWVVGIVGFMMILLWGIKSEIPHASERLYNAFFEAADRMAPQPGNQDQPVPR